MAMGQDGMHEMSEMNMGGPKNTLPMMTGTGQFGPISMGGMFTVLKIRDGITSYEDPGWYRHPDGTVGAKSNCGIAFCRRLLPRAEAVGRKTPGKTPAGAHSRSSPTALRSPPAMARQVHPAAIPLMNQTTRHYPLRGIHPSIG